MPDHCNSAAAPKKLRGGSEDEAPAPRKVGCLIVGLGGNNGCTVLAGLVANRRRLAWEGQKRRIDADWGGCLTQRGDLAEKMASFEHAAVGGWDVRPTKLGAALLAARIVDTDLARLVEAELDAVEVMPGVYDERYAAVATADALLDMLAGPLEYDAPPSLLYAVAAALEGCSFVNGGSQDTVCDGLAELCERKGAYALGTDFKAGQTKFKTCAVEYLENNGFTVKVVASSNHLGNNDMRNLALGTPTQARTNAAKLRVKSSIFKPGVDHHVAEATAYLFKVPEGRAKAEAQGFHAQLDTMKRTVAAVEAAEEDVEALVEEVEALVVDKEEPLVEQEDGNEAPAEREAEDTPKPEEAPSKPAVVCCGLACLDLELGGASDGGREAINGFEAATSRAGGSAASGGDELARLLLDKGVRVDAPPRFDAARTGLAVVPVFSDGGRGCYFGAGANADFGGEDVVEGVARQVARGGVLAVHVGYPHLLPRLRGVGLRAALARVRELAPNALISLDVNGVGPRDRLGDGIIDDCLGGGPGALPRRGAPRGVEFADELEARGGRARCPGPARPTRTAPATRSARASSPPSSPATAP
ncbi:inositol-3-phosphate synthase [Aureococcus anophagefferens]|nr:inositol-3-phosphate synthase [Aureococcus anophagefferens]